MEKEEKVPLENRYVIEPPIGRHDVLQGGEYLCFGSVVKVMHTYRDPYTGDDKAIVDDKAKRVVFLTNVSNLVYSPPQVALNILKEIQRNRESKSLAGEALRFMFQHDIPLLKRFLAGYFMTSHHLEHKVALKAADWVGRRLERKEDEEPAC